MAAMVALAMVAGACRDQGKPEARLRRSDCLGFENFARAQAELVAAAARKARDEASRARVRALIAEQAADAADGWTAHVDGEPPSTCFANAIREYRERLDGLGRALDDPATSALSLDIVERFEHEAVDAFTVCRTWGTRFGECR